jgi:hypothetical protein
VHPINKSINQGKTPPHKTGVEKRKKKKKRTEVQTKITQESAQKAQWGAQIEKT